MNPRHATTLSVAALAGASCLLTAYLVPVPIWVLFIAWASFFAAGGGTTGLVKSVVLNLAGVLSASVSLALIAALGGSGWATALVVVAGAGILVLIGRPALLSFAPAGFFGFASTVGVCAATGAAVTDPFSSGHPVLLVVGALLLGASFGRASELLAGALTARQVEPVVAGS